MLESLINIFQKSEDSESKDKFDDLDLLCGLMIEAANTDGIVTKEEIKKISTALVEIFKKKPEEVKVALEESIKNKDDSKSLYSFTSKINKNFSDEKKVLIIEILWEIILADGKVHDFESNLIRRLAGLLYISDVNCGNAKKKALEKIAKKGSL